MTNPHITQAVATERIRQLHLDAERYRLARAARAGRPRPALRQVARASAWLHAAWTSTVTSPRRFRSFVLAGQLGSGYQADCS